MTEPYKPNEILTHSEREALNGLRRRATRSGWVAHQIWPLAIILAVLGIMMTQGAGSMLLLAPIAIVVVYVWNAHRQGLDEIAIAINGLYKIAEEAERRRNSPL